MRDPVTVPAFPSIWGLDDEELRRRVVAAGLDAYRARQLRAFTLRHPGEVATDSSVLGPRVGARLSAVVDLALPPEIAQQRSADGQTVKSLLRLADGVTVEAVLMCYSPEAGKRERRTLCVSTQAGCAMGCVFCATGQQGLVRDLDAAEIVAQVTHAMRLPASRGRCPTNVVFMGMGEPLANYRATVRAVRLLGEVLGLGERRITLSTVGLVPAMRRLAREGLRVGLAVSLHSPDDALRRELVPTARFGVREILDAADEYTTRTGRRYSVEYVLIEGRNDSLHLAGRLADLLRGRTCHVNLIPWNSVPGLRGGRPSRKRTLAFEAALSGRGVNVTVRVEKGVEIAAGCGQLRGQEAGRSAEGGRAPAFPIS